MTSSRPYLVRALHEWIGDNGLTPYLLVNAEVQGLQVPPSAVSKGRVVLNIASRAISQLQITDAQVSFKARFGGVSSHVLVPMEAVMAIYAQENGQGMAFPAEQQQTQESPPEQPDPPPRRPQLRVVK